ncbi:MAG: NHL repeat-containing protein [Candidatus Latescibacterota bacterium]
MKKYITLALLAILTVACAGKVRKPVAPSTAPKVTGAVRLLFQSTMQMDARLAPRGISFGPDGALYVSDRNSRSVMRLKEGETVVSRFGGLESRTKGEFMPADVSATGGVDVFVLDGVNSRVFRLDRNLRNAAVVYGGASGEQGRFGVFSGIALDSGTGDIFLTDSANGAVVRLDPLSGAVRGLGVFGDERISLREPEGIASDNRGVLYVADRGLGSVAVLTRSGGILRFVGQNVLEAPADVAVLPGGRLAVADRRGVLIFGKDGAAEGLAGFGTDRKMQPRSVAYREGMLYVADALSGSILVYRVQ